MGGNALKMLRPAVFHIVFAEIKSTCRVQASK
jgi:hypothetical protein